MFELDKFESENTRLELQQLIKCCQESVTIAQVIKEDVSQQTITHKVKFSTTILRKLESLFISARRCFKKNHSSFNQRISADSTVLLPSTAIDRSNFGDFATTSCNGRIYKRAVWITTCDKNRRNSSAWRKTRTVPTCRRNYDFDNFATTSKFKEQGSCRH